MNRRTLSVWIVGAGLLLGAAGTFLFYDRPVGLSFPLFIGLAMAAVLGCAWLGRVPVNWRNLWPLLPALFFAVMVAVRAQSTIAFFNVTATFMLGALALHYLRRAQPLDTASTVDHLQGITLTGLHATFGAPDELGGALAWLRERSWQGRTALAVARGLLIAVPVIVIFTLLLTSADAVFADYVETIWTLLMPRMDGGLLWQVLFTAGIGWLAVGAISWGVARGAARRYVTMPDADGETEAVALDTNADDDAPAKPKRGGPLRLGIIETGIVLGLVNLLFAAFVLVQFAYFFGGADFITARGLSYGDYARRGFFELVAVSALTLGLALWLNRFTIRREVRDHTIFRALCVVLVALMTVMLVSAWQRMLLLEEAFGFTHLRVYSHVATVWLGLLFGVFLLEVFHVRRNIFALGLLLAATGYLITLNALNVDLYIAENNIARYRDGRALDLAFLGNLSVDAVPAIVPLHESLAGRPDAQEWTGQWLARELIALDALYAQDLSLLSTNTARSTAHAELDLLRYSLPVYDPYFFYSGSSYGRYFDIFATEEAPSRP